MSTQAQDVDWLHQIAPGGRPSHRVLAIEKNADDGVTVVIKSSNNVIVIGYSPAYDEIWRVVLEHKPLVDAAVLETDGDGNTYVGIGAEGGGVFKIQAGTRTVLWQGQGGLDASLLHPQMHPLKSQLTQGNFWVQNNAFSQSTGTEANDGNLRYFVELLPNGDHYTASGADGPGRFVIAKRAPNSGIYWTQFVETGGNHRHGIKLVERGGFLYTVGNVGDANGSIRLALSKINAATGAIVWQKYHDKSGRDWVKDLAVDSTGALVFTGYLNLAGTHQLMTWKYSTDGDLVWERSVPGGTNGANNVVVLNESNDIFVAGFTTINGNQNGSLTKYSAAGTQLWTRSVGFSGSDELTHLFLSEGHPVAAGYVQESGSSRKGFFARFRTNDSATMDSAVTDLLGGSPTPRTYQAGDGSLYLVSTSDFITKMNAEGVVQWSRIPSFGLVQAIGSVTFDPDSNPVFATAAAVSQGGPHTMVITKLSKIHGGVIWQRTVGQFDVGGQTQIIAGKNGDYYVTHRAHNNSEAELERGTYIYRLNQNGQVIWTQHLVLFQPQMVVDADGALVILFGSPVEGENRFLKRMNLTSGSQLWLRPTLATTLLIGGDGVPVIGNNTFTEKVRLHNGGFYWKVTSALPIFVDANSNVYTAKTVGMGQQVSKLFGNNGTNLWTSSIANMGWLMDSHVAGTRLAIGGYTVDHFYPREDGRTASRVALLNTQTGQLEWERGLPISGSDEANFVSINGNRVIVAGGGNFGLASSAGFVAAIE